MPDGNAAAADGAHDDCVMAMAIALAVRRQDVGRGVKKRTLEMASLVVEVRGELGKFIRHIGVASSWSKIAGLVVGCRQAFWASAGRSSPRIPPRLFGASAKQDGRHTGSHSA
jgi:hypothetical protein